MAEIMQQSGTLGDDSTRGTPPAPYKTWAEYDAAQKAKTQTSTAATPPSTTPSVGITPTPTTPVGAVMPTNTESKTTAVRTLPLPSAESIPVSAVTPSPQVTTSQAPQSAPTSPIGAVTPGPAPIQPGAPGQPTRPFIPNTAPVNTPPQTAFTPIVSGYAPLLPSDQFEQLLRKSQGGDRQFTPEEVNMATYNVLRGGQPGYDPRIDPMPQGYQPSKPLRTPTVLNLKPRTAPTIESAGVGGGAETQAIDAQIRDLEGRLGQSNNYAEQQAIRGAITELRKRRPNAENVVNRLEIFNAQGRKEEIANRQGEIAQQLATGNLPEAQRNQLMLEGQNLAKEDETLSKIQPRAAGAQLSAVAPPKGKKDENFRFTNGMVVDADGNAVTDPTRLNEAMASSPRLTRDLTLAGIDEKLRTTSDPLERASLQQSRAQAELDYYANKPKDKERNWKDFFIGLAMGALRGYASGGLTGALSGAAVGGIGSVINPNFDDVLVDETFRKPMAQQRLDAATAAQASAIETRKSMAALGKSEGEVVELSQKIRDNESKFRYDSLLRSPTYATWLQGTGTLTPKMIAQINADAKYDTGLMPGMSRANHFIRLRDGRYGFVGNDGEVIEAWEFGDDGIPETSIERGQGKAIYTTPQGNKIEMTEEQLTQLKIDLYKKKVDAQNRLTTENLQYQLGLNTIEYRFALENQQNAAAALPKLQSDIARLEREIANAQETLKLKSQHQMEFVEGGKLIPYEDVVENRQGVYKQLQLEIQKLNQEVNDKTAQLSEIQSQLAEVSRVAGGSVGKPNVPGVVAPPGEATDIVAPKGKKAEGTTTYSNVLSYLKP